MKTNEILGGFDALFDSLTPNEDIKIKGVELVDDPNEPANDTVAIDGDEPEVDEIPLSNDKPVDTEQDEVVEIDDNETSRVTAFFDAIAEQVGWDDIEDGSKPKSVDDFVKYMKEAVEQSSQPQYASDEIAELDEFVKNGGNIHDFFTATSADVDYKGIDLTDVENQKAVVREFLSEKGFSEVQIKRKLEKYEDADLLEDEATDAVEFLEESKEQKKKALLDEQRIANETSVQEQQKFYNNVVEQIEALTDVRGIKIPKEDKKTLMEYIFRVEADGRTKYQKDYSKSTKNLIESAYFTMKGDKLIENAKRSGETSATERLKNTLKTTKVGGSKQTINDGSPTPLWSVASQQLLRRPQ